MPLAFLVIGGLLVVVAVRGTYSNLGTLLVNDFTGQGSNSHGFLVWVAAIAAIGALGWIPGMRTPSRYLLAMVVLAIFLSNTGVFAEAQKALKSGIPGVTVSTAQAAPTAEPLPQAIPVQVTGASGTSGAAPTSAGGAVSEATGAVGLLGKVAGIFGGI